MKSEQRAAIVAIVIAANSKEQVKSVYNYEKSRTVNISGSVTSSKISIYDYDRACKIKGSASSKHQYSLYDYGVPAYIDLAIEDDTFSGYDYGKSFQFSGTIKSGLVSFFDNETSTSYSFTSF